ncbi:hypothetical protein BJY00DRAFT_321335 [Aspergillus carlsbadensis]|nr:hypothetical protein BJY00DRAFT_321335 [Aspergillus carlsbadensis]
MSMLVHDLGFSHRACDRCNGQKLRCRRESNSSTCVRCARAGVRCTQRPSKLRSRAQSTNNAQQRHQSQPHANTGPPPGKSSMSKGGGLRRPLNITGNQQEETNGANDEHPDHIDCLAPTMLEMPAELDLEVDSSSVQAEIHLEARTHSLRASQPPRLRTADQTIQTRWNDVPNQDIPEDLFGFALPDILGASCQPPYDRHRQASLPGNISTPHTQQLDQEATMLDPGPPPGVSKAIEAHHSRSVSAYPNDLSLSDLLGSPFADVQDSDSESRSHPAVHQNFVDGLSDQPDADASSWIRKLSDANIQLHQHLHSIPVASTKPKSEKRGSRISASPIELPVDSTFELASQYTTLLASIYSHLEPGDRPKVSLDQPSQLLVLSSYMSLLESYDRILQHIKAWLEARLSMKAQGSLVILDGDDFLLRLPSVAVGSFELPKTSSIHSVVLTCIMRTNMMQIRSLITEIMMPGSKSIIGRISTDKRSVSGLAETGDRLSTVAKATLHAIEAIEDSTLQLVHIVSKLALSRVMV